MTRRIPGAHKAAKSSGSRRLVQGPVWKELQACQAWCSCACHTKKAVRLSQPSMIGSVVFSYSGMPWVTAVCDQKSCQHRSLPTLALAIQFPTWFWDQYLLSSFSYTSFAGPNISLKLPRTVSWASPLWRHSLNGDVGAIQKLYAKGLASPWDVQSLCGSALHYAADHGHWDCCKFLISQGAVLDNEDAFHNTPKSLA